MSAATEYERRRQELDAAFWEKTERSSGCWLWTGALANRKGHRNAYGQLQRRGRLLLAHRVAYERAVGPIPDGMMVCHHCDQPRCIRPDHLFLGTPADNMHDMIDKGRQRWVTVAGEQNGRARLTQAQVDAIRVSGETPLGLAARFGISRSTIYSILRGRSWGVLR